jgi:hypothetical protein
MTSSKKRIIILSVFVLLSGILFQSCINIKYSFTGAEIVGETISINYFQNKAPIIQATLSQVFTEALRDKFTSQSKLDLINGEADLHLEGEIVGYSVTSIALQANETAAKNRLTIQVNVRFTNKQKPKDNFEQTFSSFYDFESKEALSSVENQLIETIVKRLTEDIFNKAVVNW